MLIVKRFAFATVASILLLNAVARAQQPSPALPTSAVKTVEVSVSMKEAEVGQTVKLTVVAKNAAGNIVNEQPSTYFAGPFDAAAADDSGNVKLFGPGEITAGAIVGGKPGF